MVFTQSNRIGDNLSEYSEFIRRQHFVNHDNLAIKVFDADLIPSKVNDFYINTSFDPIGPSDSFENDIFSNLGGFERQILSKLIKPAKKIIFIRGDAGCGKTTTINYLTNLIKSTNNDDPNYLFVPIIINFNNRKYEENDEDQAEFLLYDEICSNLRGQINLHNLISIEKELVDYWNHGFDKARKQVTGYSVFTRIAEKTYDTTVLLRNNPNYESLYESRNKIFSEISNDKQLYFSYLLGLWDFVLENSGENSCSYIVLDNIDKASLVVQSTIVSIIDSVCYEPGPPVIVTLRPETFSNLSIKRYRGSRTADVIDHPGFSPTSVIKDRLTKFIRCSPTYFNKDDGLSEEQRASITSFMKSILEIYSSDRGIKHTSFLDAACSRCLRQALILAQKYFKISDVEFNDGSISPHTLNRIIVVNQGDEVRDENKKYFIPNIFMTKDKTSLLKLRILNYIVNQPDRCTEQFEIRKEMEKFGYSETKEIRFALSDLLNFSSGLLRTNGLESYNSDKEFLSSSNNKIGVTKKGIGYIDNIIFNLDYIQEIMLDSQMPSEWLRKQIPFSSIPEKLSLTLNFLDYLHRTDLAETENYILFDGIDNFRKNHGNALVTIPLIVHSCNAINSIFSSIINSEDISSTNKYETPLQSAISLLYNAKEKNRALLGVYNKDIEKTHNDISLSLDTYFRKQ